MAFSDHIQSKYLKASDLPAPRVRVTISEFETHDVGMPKEQKLVVFFTEFDKGLILNVTNMKKLASLFGNDESAAIGQSIDLVIRQTEYQGAIYDVIRIEAPARSATVRAPAMPAPPPESDIPF